MGKRYIDCSLNIVGADSWVEYPQKLVVGARELPVRVERLSNVKEHRWASFYLSISTQCFTHVESSSHFFEGGVTIDQVAIDQFINDGVVIDMMHKKAGEGVTGKDLERAKADVRPGDTIIIRTGWTDRAFLTREFWEKMVYLDESAADWIVSQKPKALMQDFFTDVSPLLTCNHCGSLVPNPNICPNHYKFLGGANMLLIEWCTNLGAIKKPRVQVIALPLKLKGTEGAPARVVVVEED